MNLYTPASKRGTMEGQSVPADALLMLLDGHRLSPAQRRIAQYLLDHMPDSAFLSSVVLARRAGVSQPSVTRFAAALGFSGYPAFRDALRAIALDAPGAATLAGPAGLRLASTGGRPGPGGPAAGRDDAGSPMQAAVADEIANLQALHELLADPRA